MRIRCYLFQRAYMGKPLKFQGVSLRKKFPLRRGEVSRNLVITLGYIRKLHGPWNEQIPSHLKARMVGCNTYMEDKFLLGGFGSKITFHSFLGNVWFVISSFQPFIFWGGTNSRKEPVTALQPWGNQTPRKKGWATPNIQKHHFLGKLRKFDDWKHDPKHILPK